MELMGRTAVITGGASGLGASTAQLLASLGVNVAILDRHEETAEAMARLIDSLPVICDVSDADSVRQAIGKVIETYGQIHIVVNCAGIAPAGRLVGKDGPIDVDVFQKAVQVNLIGTVNVMSQVAAQMMKQEPLSNDGERGVIINTASVAAYEGQVGQSAYAASKGGVVSLTLPAAREFASFGIRVMTIAPGVMETPMMSTITEEYAERLISAVPFPQRLGSADEYAQLVESIIENPYLNGSVIRLDGALRMQRK